MTISLQCSCGKKLQVEDTQAGGQATCPECQATLAIPAAISSDDGLEGLSLDDLDLDDLSLDDLSLDDVSLDDVSLDDLAAPGAATGSKAVNKPAADASPKSGPQTRQPAVDDDDDYELDVDPPAAEEPLDIGSGALDGLEDSLADDLASTSANASKSSSKPAAAAKSKADPLASAAAKCPNCGTGLAAGAVLCVGCGLDLRTGEKHSGFAAPAATTLPASGSTTGAAAIFKQYRIPILASAGGLVVVLGIIAFLFSGGEEPRDRSAVAKSITAEDLDSDTTDRDDADDSTDGADDATTDDPSGVASGDNSASVSSPAGSTNAAASEDDPSQATLAISLEGHTANVTRLAFSEDAQRAITIDSRGAAMVWNLADGAVLLKLNVTPRGQVIFLPGAEQLLVHEGRNQLKVVDLATGQPAQTIEGAVGGDLALAIAANGKTALLSGSREALASVDLASGRVTVSAVEFPRTTRIVRFSPDGQLAVVVDDSPTLAVWDVMQQQQAGQLDGHVTEVRAFAISADSNQALTAAGGQEFVGDARSRKLAHTKITDLALRLWDLQTGEELRRFAIDSTEPAEAVLFVGTDYGMWAGSAVQVFDLESGAPLVGIELPTSDNPPARLPAGQPRVAAAASADGKQLLIAATDNSVRLWRLPDLAALKSQLPPTVRPGPLPPLADLEVETAEPAALEMDEQTKAVWRAVAKHHPALKDLWKHLNARPRTADNLMTIAQWCAKQKLYLEAEECLRAVLAVAPATPKAAEAYEKLAMLTSDVARSVEPTVSIAAAPEGKLIDDIQDITPPADKSLVIIPLRIDASAAAVRIDDKTLLAQSSGGPAEFLGILREPTSEVKGLVRNEPQPAKATQLWEIVVANTRVGGETLVRFQNRQRPRRESKTRGRPTASDPIVIGTDRSYFDEPYSGPYEALFAIPAGNALTEIKFGEEPPFGLLTEQPESMSDALADANADPGQLVPLMQLAAASPGPDTSKQLDQILARSDATLFAAARQAQRLVRRERNLLAPVFHPVVNPAGSFLESLVIDVEAAPLDARRPVAATGQQPLTISTTWNLPAPGKYTARVFAFGVAARYQLQATAFVAFEARQAGLVYWSHLVAGEPAAPNRVVELWRDGILLERSLIALDEAAAAEIAGRVPLIKPASAVVATTSVRRPPVRRPAGAQSEPTDLDIAELIESEPIVPVPAVALLEARERDLPLLYRIARYYMAKEVADAEPERTMRVLAEVGRLEAANPTTRQEAAAAIAALLADSAPGLLVRLLRDGPDSVRPGTIEALTSLAPQSAAACRALLHERERDTAPVIDKLVAEGVLENHNGAWILNGETIHTDPAMEEPEAGEETETPAGE